MLAERLNKYISVLKKHEGLAEWYYGGNSPDKRLHKRLSASDASRLTDESVRKEGHLSFGAWNGGMDDAGARIMVGAGIDSPWLANAVVLTLPKANPPAWMQSPSAMRELLRATVLCWQPEWATVTSHELRAAQPDARPPRLVLGWATYIAEPTATPVRLALPATTQVESDPSGIYMSFGDDPLCPPRDQVLDARAALGPLTSSWPLGQA